ncbi:YfbK domain-containing protein [Polluticoccus soli]|uniref:YfbK domain-containing protein n=1 Tax=Polluticoccus soli TaxID=3034150 RepID=UPI0023E2B955|nr:von Willebrand factor type A domain-containing protein [Flavipsychrobacter sp. JY13-12]
MKQVFSFLMMLCMAFVASAQSGAITGTVVDEKKEPMIAAIVTVLQGKQTKGGATTDESGTYVIKPLPPGRYKVQVKYGGYKTSITENVIVGSGKHTTVNVAMQLDAKQLNEIVVLQYKTPHIDPYGDGRQTKSSEEIEKMPTRATDGIRSTMAGVYPAPQAKYKYTPPVYYNPSNESYKKDPENDFKSVKANPLSTLSVDVDRASYSNIRRFLNEGQKPPADAVRVEEMINYFDYEYPQPKGYDPIAITTEMIDCPWQKGHKLLHIGMQAKTISTEKLPPSNITFLIDVSGSMNEANKLPLVKQALKMLAGKLRAEDRLSIVVYAGAAGLVLPPTPGSNKETIFAALDALQAGGSTAGGAGIRLAYKTAAENFMRGGNNRVVLATDGDFNVGVSNENELEDLITKERDKGIYLTCLGFGMGNYKDSKMEVLADKGNGNYAYIDNVKEAEKTLVKEFGGTIFTIAKDVKAQIEFNPALVKSYRLVGYENRILNEEDFKDDKKDAGDMGSGHTVTIMYEIIPVGVDSKFGRDVDPLKYQNGSIVNHSGELATIKFRYKRPNANTSQEMVHTITNSTKHLMLSTDNIRLASSVAMFGMLLKDSKYKGASTYDAALRLAESSRGKDKEGYRTEFISLIRKAGNFPAVEKENTEALGWNGVD